MNGLWLILCLLPGVAGSLDRVIQPKRGEVVVTEKTYEILWEGVPEGNVKIELHWADKLPATSLIESTANDNCFNWSPFSGFSGKENYYIEICELPEGKCISSDRFRIATAEELNTPSLTSTVASTTSAESSSSPGTTFLFLRTSSATSAIPTTPTSTPTPSNKPNQTGLSSGAKIGLGVGLTLCAVLAAIGVYVWFAVLKPRRRKAAMVTKQETYFKAELSAEEKEVKRAELEGTLRRDAEVEAEPVELPGTSVGAAMDALSNWEDEEGHLHEDSEGSAGNAVDK